VCTFLAEKSKDQSLDVGHGYGCTGGRILCRHLANVVKLLRCLVFFAACA